MREERAANSKRSLEQRTWRQIDGPAQIVTANRARAQPRLRSRDGIHHDELWRQNVAQRRRLECQPIKRVLPPADWRIGDHLGLKGCHPARVFGRYRSIARGNSANFLQRCEKRPRKSTGDINTLEPLHFSGRRRNQDSEKFELTAIQSLDCSECRRQLAHWLIAEEEFDTAPVFLRQENGVTNLVGDPRLGWSRALQQFVRRNLAQRPPVPGQNAAQQIAAERVIGFLLHGRIGIFHITKPAGNKED